MSVRLRVFLICCFAIGWTIASIPKDHRGEAGAVSPQAGQESQGPAGGLARSGGVRVQYQHLIDDQGGLTAEDPPRCAGVGRSNQQQYGSGGSVAGQLELARAQRGQYPPLGRYRRLRLVEVVQVV